MVFNFYEDKNIYNLDDFNIFDSIIGLIFFMCVCYIIIAFLLLFFSMERICNQLYKFIKIYIYVRNKIFNIPFNT